MAEPAAKDLARLAELILDIESKRKLCDELQRELEPLARAMLIVVDGEVGKLNELQQLLAEAMSKVEALRQEEMQALTILDELEDILCDVQWDLVDDIRQALKKKAQFQQEHVRKYDERLAEWPKFTRSLLDALEEANRMRAAVRRERVEITRLDAQVTQARRLFDEGKYVEVERLLAELEAGRPFNEKDYLQQLQKGTEEAKRFIRQADLLLLRSPEDAHKRYPYNVLLRTPSEPGTHGINIQGSSTIASYDRRGWGESIQQITDAVDRGLRRAYELDREAQTSDAPAPANPPPPAAAETAADESRNFSLGDNLTSASPAEDLNLLIKQIGDEMYRLLMPDQMQNYLYENQCSITITTNDLELPWELMSYRDTFLCLDRPVARMPMGRTFPRTPRFERTDPKLRFLLIYSDPQKNLSAAENEVRTVEQRLKEEWQEHIEVEVIKPEQASGRKFNEVLRKGTFDVIHYAGHAYFDNTDADLSGLLLADGDHLLAQKIRRLLEGRPLVFLNACQSSRIANERELQQVGAYLQGPAEGLASSFIYGGALGCIGANWPIYDAPAAEFAISFYSNVLKGHMIGEAMRRARLDIKERFPNQITWAAFVLYGDPTFRL